MVEPHASSRIEYMIKAKSQFKSRSIANNVEIIIPVPSDVDSPSFKASIGTVVYLPDKVKILYKILDAAEAIRYIFDLISQQTRDIVPLFPCITIAAAMLCHMMPPPGLRGVVHQAVQRLEGVPDACPFRSPFDLG